MKRKRHSEEQIIAILKEHEAGMKTADLCRKHGISEGTFSQLEYQAAEGAGGREHQAQKTAMLDNAALEGSPVK
jgi:putative transposase